MSSKFIIPNADFSANGIKEYTFKENFDSSVFTTVFGKNPNTLIFLNTKDIDGTSNFTDVAYGVEVAFTSIGTFKAVKYNYSTNTTTEIKEFAVSKLGKQVYLFDAPVALSSNERIGFLITQMSFKWDNNANGQFWQVQYPGTGTSHNGTMPIRVITSINW